mmetsp:Transcript_22315/g.31418  ORF Transcript_22315/g.31418 Transcript_22315/m.31418 type:complete len:316 (+) Transcript_22315:85-1032(+)
MDDAAVVSGSDLNADDSSSSEEENENFMDEFDDDNNSNNNNNQQTNKRISDCKNDNGSETDSDDENEGHHDYGIPRRDILYNPNKDEEDEAYVYRNLRGGMNELVSMKVSNNQKRRNVSSVSRPSSSTSVSDSYNNNDNTKNNINKNNSNNNNNNNGGGEEGGKLTRVLKPRNSDGVLSCPCCFQIVCMDCQRHDRYTNQFRAMFVMNIGVDWERIVTPMGKQNTGHYLNGGQNYNNNNDNTHESSSHPLLHKKKRVEKIPTDDLQDDNNIHTFRGDDTEGEVYYSVHCVSCRTEVAALNMEDEVYHFFGCLASS